MIASLEDRTPSHVVNILNPGDFEHAKLLVDYINDAEYEILINGAHRFLMERVAQGSICYRPGFKNMFWFFSLEDAERFAADLKDWNPQLSEDTST